MILKGFSNPKNSVIGSVVEICLFGLREAGEMNPTPGTFPKLLCFTEKKVTPDLLLWSLLPVTWMCPPGLAGIWKSSLLVMPKQLTSLQGRKKPELFHRIRGCDVSK